MHICSSVLALLACGSLAAQDVGLGARKASGQRFEAPYTLDVVTPHEKWAWPPAGGPIRLLAVPSVHEGRTLVELAERLSLDLTTVTIDPAWDVNKWTMAFGRNYGARAEKGDLSLVYSYLEAELTSDKKFDAVLLPLNHGWERLTPASREALARRVREGCGLVLIRPAGELSPLAPETEVAAPTDASSPVEPGRPEKSSWQRAGDHYITRAIPIETFPFRHLENHVYRAVPDASVLIRTETGHPVLAVRPFGKGRVVAFAYRSDGLSWRIPMAARHEGIDIYFEYFYALLCRALIYAAGRAPAAPPGFNAAGVAWRLKDAGGEVRQSGSGPHPSIANLAPGRWFLEQQAAGDFKISAIEIPQPDKIEDLAVTPALIAEGDSVQVEWRSARPARIELIDGLGRVIARETGAGQVRLRARRPLTHSGVVRATRGTAVEQHAVRFAASSRGWSDYEVMLPWSGPRAYQPWIAALDEQFRKIGVTTLASPERNFKIMASAHLPGFGIYWYRRDAYLKRKAAYAETGDKKHLTRDVTLQTPEFERGLRAQLDKSFRPLAPLKPMAVYLADESSLTAYTDAFDVDWSPPALGGFRAWLSREYGALESLNASWGTHFRDWNSVLPMTAEEAQKHGNYAPWADHRAYMEQEFVQAFALASKLVHEIDPGARASISGTQVPTAHNGCNWYAIDQHIDYLQPYSGGSQDAMHHLFRPGIPITGFTGYGLTGAEAQYQQWQRLFYGHTGASIFWHYTLLNPDLTLSEQGKALAEAFGRIQSGIGRVFMNSPVREDGVAIHFSMASIRGAWITDGKITAAMGNAQRTSKNFAELMERRDAWVKALERQGAQFRFLAAEQIEAGALDKYRVLIMPYSIAVSDKEAAAIGRFLDRGGVVYTDDQTGRMDERCHWRKQPLWSGGGRGVIRRGPGEVGLKRAIDVEGEFLTTVRDFGHARLIGLLPKSATEVRLPALPGVTYDLLRGGIAAPRLEAGPDRPVLLVNRATRIARLELDGALNLWLTDENDAPVERSVVRIEVFDPAGRLVRHYSSNATIARGRAHVEIPFAWNDAPGDWRVRARDVVSGVVAERVIGR